jgi:hypothetical protein
MDVCYMLHERLVSVAGDNEVCWRIVAMSLGAMRCIAVSKGTPRHERVLEMCNIAEHANVAIDRLKSQDAVLPARWTPGKKLLYMPQNNNEPFVA